MVIIEGELLQCPIRTMNLLCHKHSVKGLIKKREYNKRYYAANKLLKDLLPIGYNTSCYAETDDVTNNKRRYINSGKVDFKLDFDV